VREVSGKTIKDCSLVEPAASLSDVRYDGCQFDRCFATVQQHWPDADHRIRISNVVLNRCRTDGSVLSLAGVVLEDVVVADFVGAVHAAHCSFTRVRLSGSFRGFRVDSFERPVADANFSYWHNLALANDEVAASADWALDVSEARFDSGSMILGVAAHLIRIDPSRQAVVTPESVVGAEGIFSDDDLLTEVGVGINQALQGREDSSLISVSSNARKPDRELALIQMVHELGFALPVMAGGGA